MALIEKLVNIANAIRNKTGKTGNLTLPQMVEEINTLSNTSNDTVTSNDMPANITAHDSSGNQITGTLTDHKAYNNTDYSIDSYIINQEISPSPQFSITQKWEDLYGNLNGSAPQLKFTFKEDEVYRKESSVSFTFPEILIGNATAADVVKGKTFSSVDGFNKIGTYVDNSLLCDATASDILSGKTACVNGEIVTGSTTCVMVRYPWCLTADTVKVNETDVIGEREIRIIKLEGNQFYNFYVVPAHYDNVCFKPNSELEIDIKGDLFGNALAENVIKGNTFTSENGFCIEGTFDLSDTTATATNILDGKTAYISGGKVTGTMPSYSYGNRYFTMYDEDHFVAQGYHDGSGVFSIAPEEQSKFIPSNIKSGVTILGVTGDYEGEGGIDTSDATAVANDIAKGKTAYVNGELITGTIRDVASGSVLGQTIDTLVNSPAALEYGYIYISNSSTTGNISIQFCPTYKSPYILREGSKYNLNGIKSYYFGTATASDVASGKTFTGADGFLVEGTAQLGTGVEYCEFSATDPTVTFTKTSGTLKVYGYAKGASSGWTSTAYAFNGTSYTTVVSYGTGTTTQMTLGLSGGKITGLPTMTSGTLVAILE